jgi:hypothetical protein
MPNLSLVAGQVLGQVSAASATEVQTLTYSATPTSGTYTLSIIGIDGLTTYTTDPITGLGLTAAALTVVINALLLAAGYAGCTAVVTGTTTTGAFTITFATGALLRNMPAISATVIDLLDTATPITITMATSVAGNRIGLFGAYDGTKLAAPALPTVAWHGSGGYFPVDSTHIVCITHLTAQGESLPSPGKIMVKSAATDSLDVTPATLPVGTTGINIYVDGHLAATSAQTTATLVNVPGVVTSLALGTLAGIAPPRESSAFTNTDGRHIAKAILTYDIMTDEMGRVVFGTSISNPQDGFKLTAPAWFSGEFDTSLLTGLDAGAVANLGRIKQGTLAAGVLAVI